MKITITEKEFDAINFALEQVLEALEGSCDEDFKQSADKAIDELYSVVKKYQSARIKANDLNEARRYIRSRNYWMPQSKVDKMARLMIKKRKEHENRRYRKSCS